MTMRTTVDAGKALPWPPECGTACGTCLHAGRADRTAGVHQLLAMGGGRSPGDAMEEDDEEQEEEEQEEEAGMSVDVEMGPAAAQLSSGAGPHSLTLADAADWHEGRQFTEVKHMQPVVMRVLRAVAKAVGCSLHVVDTHKECDLQDPASRPDCVVFAHPVQSWSTVVVNMDFKLHDADRQTMLGQLMQRSAGEQTPHNCSSCAARRLGAMYFLWALLERVRQVQHTCRSHS
jgi:hypothetical protein